MLGITRRLGRGFRRQPAVFVGCVAPTGYRRDSNKSHRDLIL